MSDNLHFTAELPAPLIEAIALRVVEMIDSRPAASASPYLDHAEAADYLRATPKRLYDLVSARAIPVYKDGSRNLYRRVDLDAYLEAGQ